MKGDTKTLLDFFKLVGKVEFSENYSDEVESIYAIKLEPDESIISVFDLEKLKDLVAPNKVSVWFFNNPDTKENQCNIEIEIMRAVKN